MGIGFLQIIEHIGMVLQYILLPQDLPEHFCRLFNDGGIGDDIDHPTQTVLFCVRQSKGKGGHGFSSTCWHSEGKQSRRLCLSFFHAPFQDLAALGIQLSAGWKPA